MEISTAITQYLEHRSPDVSQSTIQNHRYQLKQFQRWAGSNRSLEAIDPADILEFRSHRSAEVNENTLYNQLTTLRLFLDYSNRRGWVDQSVVDVIVTPTRSGKSRSSTIAPDRITAILAQLERIDPEGLDRVLLALLWTCGLRIGALRSLDIGDIYPDNQYIELVHRPPKTPLKNGNGSEREIALHGWVAELLSDWIDRRPPADTDRKPLITSRRSNGRLARSTIRRRIYRLTDCADRLEETCDCAGKCDRSTHPHAIRRSAITFWLSEGHAKQLLSDRFDVSTDVMAEHYDVRSASAKRQLRADEFDL